MSETKPAATATLSRRKLIGASIGLGGITMSGVGTGAFATGSSPARDAAARPKADGAPFRSMRDYIAAMEEWGTVLHIPRADQDAYEVTALMYRIREQHGMRGAPILVIDEIKIDGEWVKGPLVVNESGHLYGECLIFNLEPVDEGPLHKEPYQSYRKAREHVMQMVAENDGEYPQIPPLEIAHSDAPCKQVVLTGDDIDLTKFPFIQCNPADVGRYINTGCVFTRDPKYGVNFGTYRCHLRGPREIGLNSEPGQTGHRHLSNAARRGEKVAKVSIVLTPDPYVWLVSGNKMIFRRPADELAIAGGLAGRPIEVVRSETNDFMIPAHAEMVIEGEVPLDDLRPEGPYGEMVGYQGRPKEQQFWMRVTAVTHRREPWIMNNFTGTQAGSLMAAAHARSLYKIKRDIPAIVDFFGDTRSVGVTFVSIDKTRPGQGLEIAERIAEDRFFAKIVIVVDADLDITNQEQMLAALGARWQPYGNTTIYEKLPTLPLDPSTIKRGRGSKIAIDATRQWPEEGGPETFPGWNRTLLEAGAPDAFANVDAKWGEQIRDWRFR
jgi:4-hydroxy-3-polyprenylbenzoate decarboxylase